MERMVLASSNEADMVLDPFAGSGTTLRVCQQLLRRSTGIELNPEFAELIKSRMKETFNGFDSVDSRMKRIPHDLNDPVVREEYRRNHKRWFLTNHPQEQSDFDSQFESKYPSGKSPGKTPGGRVKSTNSATLQRGLFVNEEICD